MANHQTDPECVFCKIIAGELPCYKLYEDEQVLAFLDIGPLSDGHCVVIPKSHYVTLDQMPDDAVAACTAILPKLGKAIVEAVGADGWNVLQNNGQVAGQVVGHVHFHIIPRCAGDGLGYRWNAGQLDGDLAKQLVNKING